MSEEILNSGENSEEVVSLAPETENPVIDEESFSEGGSGDEEIIEEESPPPKKEDDHIQTPAQRAKWAEMRRKAERAQQLESELARYKELEKEYEEYGLRGPEAIAQAVRQEKQRIQESNQNEDARFDTWLSQQVKHYRDAGESELAIESFVIGKKAEYRAYKLERKIEQDKQLQTRETEQRKVVEQQTAAQKQFEADFKELQAEYPDIKTVESIASKLGEDVHAKFVDKLKRGYSLLDAYESVNRGASKQKAAAAAKQAALNSVNGKQHLKTEKATNNDTSPVNIDPEELARFRSMFRDRPDSDFAYFKKNGKLPKRK